MREHGRGELADVLRDHVLAALDERARLCEPEERDPRARARPEGEVPVLAGVAQERDDVAGDALLDEDLSRGRDRGHEVGSPATGTSAVERLLAGLLGEHPRLLRERRVADRHLDGEPVELRLGQRVGALVLDRILGREREERPLQRVRLAVDRHLRLLHRLEQRGLGLR